MNKLMLLAILSLTCCVIPITCKNVYIVGFFLVDKSPTEKFTGNVQLGCLEGPCDVTFSIGGTTKKLTVDGVGVFNHYVAIAPHSINSIIFALRIETTSKMTIAASITNSTHISDTFSIYPILEEDTFFTMAVPRDTSFVVIFALLSPKETVQVTLTTNNPHNKEMIQSKVDVTAEEGYLWRGEIVQLSGSTIRSPKPLSVYYGGQTIKGSVQSLKKQGRSYFLFRPNIYGSAIVFVPTCNIVSWEDETGKTGWENITECFKVCTKVASFEVSHAWKVLVIKAAKDVMVVYEYSNIWCGSMPSTPAVPMEFYVNQFIIRPPYNEDVMSNGPVEVMQMLAIIAKKGDFDKILANGANLMTSLKLAKKKYEVKGSDYAVWCGLPHFQTTVFELKAEYKNSGIKFLLVSYGYTKVDSYLDQPTGVTSYSKKEKNLAFTVRLDNCSDVDPDLNVAHAVDGKEKQFDRQKTALYEKQTIIILSIVYVLVAVLIFITISSLCKLYYGKES